MCIYRRKLRRAYFAKKGCTVLLQPTPKLSLNAEYAKIWPNITVKKAPPPDSNQWEGKPDKLQYFSPTPGAGD